VCGRRRERLKIGRLEAAKNNIVRIKHGKGRTAKVQFKKSDLDAYLENNTVHMRRAGRSAK